jgi:uncharacterized cupredoxin-like copper-binding protein
MRFVRVGRSCSARLATAAVLATTILLVVSACASGGHGARSKAAVVRITERDFKITAQRHVLPAGEADLTVANTGPDAHELIVVKEIDSRLPMRSDGLTVNEEAVERTTAGALEPGQPGGIRHLDVKLAPGRYVLFCNMSGHYMAGMQTELEVG